MNEYNVEFSSGQIKFIQDFFKEYQDQKVSTTLKKVEKIRVLLQVKTTLSAEDTVEYLLDLFQKSKYGPGLYFIARIK